MKKLTVLFSALVLIGCGGGGGSSDGGSNSVATKKEALFDGSSLVYQYNLELEDQNAPDYHTVKAEFSLKNGLVSSKVQGDEVLFSSYILAADGLYEPDTPKTYNSTLGLREFFLNENSTTTQWITVPYNQANRRGLQETVNFESVNLSGKDIAPILSPYQAAVAAVEGIDATYANLYLPFRIFQNKDKFSSDAKCLKIISTDSKIHFTFDPDIKATEIKGAKTLEDWANIEFDAGNIFLKIPTMEIWGGHRVGSLTLKDYDAQGNIQYIFAIEYNGKVYQADPEGGKRQYSDYLNMTKQNLLLTETPVLVEKVIDNLKNSCTYYNEAAVKDIEKAITKANVL